MEGEMKQTQHKSYAKWKSVIVIYNHYPLLITYSILLAVLNISPTILGLDLISWPAGARRYGGYR